MFKFIISTLVLGTLLFGAMNEGKTHKNMGKKKFQSVPIEKATILQEGEAKMYCPLCGMTLPMFYKTNHAATHANHTEQYCSLHCLVEANLENNNSLKELKVVDTKSLKFIDAPSAHYVVGSSKKGTMSMTSKYAFLKLEDAKAFQAKFGGELMSFKQAYKVASRSIKAEMQKISKKRVLKAQKGELVYNKLCKKTDKRFSSTAEAKAFIISSKICGDITNKDLQAVGVFLSK